MNYWLVKSEPAAYSWDRFVREKRSMWEGVRNYQARNYLKQMKKGDLVLFYHSVTGKQVIGIAIVEKEHYPDPTASDDRWVVVDMVPQQPLKNPVTLNSIKSDQRLAQIPLLRQSRLSVMPLKREEFDVIVELGSADL